MIRLFQNLFTYSRNGYAEDVRYEVRYVWFIAVCNKIIWFHSVKTLQICTTLAVIQTCWPLSVCIKFVIWSTSTYLPVSLINEDPVYLLIWCNWCFCNLLTKKTYRIFNDKCNQSIWFCFLSSLIKNKKIKILHTYNYLGSNHKSSWHIPTHFCTSIMASSGIENGFSSLVSC